MRGCTHVEAPCEADAGVSEVGADVGSGEAEEEAGVTDEAGVT